MKDEKRNAKTPCLGVSAAHPEDPGDLIALHAQLTCIWEATARKVGNVHRFRDFDHLAYLDFLAAAAAIGPAMRDAGRRTLGQTILSAVRATRTVANSNVNLGIILLLAPLAAAQAQNADVGQVLDATTVEDACDAYAAIRIAEPGGLGEVDAEDVSQEPTVTLQAAMALAADRDLIAAQYFRRFADVHALGVPAIEEGIRRFGNLEDAVVLCHLRWLARFPDSLLARKWGEAVAAEASMRAKQVLDSGWPAVEGRSHFQDFDAWCRDPERRRNPGT
jgi:triphosphoribosyl-dephospho-CoA synthase